MKLSIVLKMSKDIKIQLALLITIYNMSANFVQVFTLIKDNL